MVMVVVMLIFILQVASFSALSTGGRGGRGPVFFSARAPPTRPKTPSRAPLSSGGKVARACCQRANYRPRGAVGTGQWSSTKNEVDYFWCLMASMLASWTVAEVEPSRVECFEKKRKERSPRYDEKGNQPFPSSLWGTNIQCC